MISIVTYHSAYNFGSVLQAFATQTAIEKITHDVNIVNYRMKEQAEYYQKKYRTKYGTRRFVNDLSMLPIHRLRVLRAERFENFFRDYFKLTPEICEPEQALDQLSYSKIAVSGSDQIWNKHSNELNNNDWRYMDPYLLKGFNGRKISYASSIGSMTEKELQHILLEVKCFDSLSFRESVSAEKMSNLLGRPVETVLDPTFLLTKDDWISNLQLKEKDDERYILFYSLGGPKQLLRFLPIFTTLSKKLECKVKVVMPFAYFPYPNKRIEYHPEYGPVEFMSALYNAKFVITDSYHGTILSVNFGKEFYSICEPDSVKFRKTDILERLGLHERIVLDATEIPELNPSSIDYNSVDAKLSTLRQHSMNYLNSALGREK